MAKVCILGAGGFGIALAVNAHKCGHTVTIWSAFSDEIETIKADGEHKKLLPGVKISEEIKLTCDKNDVSGNDIVIFAIPSKFIRSVAKDLSSYISKNTIVVNVGKGLEGGTYKRLSEVLEEELNNEIVILSGPSHAEEVATGMPTTVLVASKNEDAAKYIREQLSNTTFRIYDSDDMIGCEIGGALKNTIALAAGISDGLGYGDNTKAALMTRGLAEITRLGVALGGKAHTFMGLSGIGDLIVTCTSMHSRNRRAGILIGKGVSPEKAVNEVGTVEGYGCTLVAYEFAKNAGVEMPIISHLYDVLYCGGDPKEAVEKLMERPRKKENE